MKTRAAKYGVNGFRRNGVNCIMAKETRLIDLNDVFPYGVILVDENNPMKSLTDLMNKLGSARPVDAVEVPDKKLLKAINILIKQYERSKNSEYVHSPVAHAFFSYLETTGWTEEMRMDSCKDCVHFGICKKGFPWADGKGGGWCEDFKNKANYQELVRCKNCKHCLRHTVPLDAYGYCKNFGYYNYAPEVQADDFCSYGERREGE